MKFYDILLGDPRMRIETFATDIYRSLCNNVWYNWDEDEIIQHSWRGSGQLVSNVRNDLMSVGEDYLNFYCSDGEGLISDKVGDFYNKNSIFILDDVYYNNINPNDHPMVKRRRGIEKLFGDS